MSAGSIGWAQVDEEFWNQSAGLFAGSTEATWDNEEVAWPALLRELDRNRPAAGRRRVLDFGCGAGQLAHFLGATGRYEVVGLDPAQEMISRAQRWVTPGVSFRRGTGQDLDSLGLFDGVVSSMVLQFVAGVEGCFQGFSSALRPGGTLAFVVFDPPFIEDHLAAESDLFFQDEGGGLRMTLDGKSTPIYERAPEHYGEMLAKAGFQDVRWYSKPYSQDQGLYRDRFLMVSCMK